MSTDPYITLTAWRRYVNRVPDHIPDEQVKKFANEKFKKNLKQAKGEK